MGEERGGKGRRGEEGEEVSSDHWFNRESDLEVVQVNVG